MMSSGTRTGQTELLSAGRRILGDAEIDVAPASSESRHTSFRLWRYTLRLWARPTTLVSGFYKSADIENRTCQGEMLRPQGLEDEI